MMTLSAMRIKTEMMLEAIREQAIEETYRQWQDAVRNYYTKGYDNGETTKLYKELEALGADLDQLYDEDSKIREEVYQNT